MANITSTAFSEKLWKKYIGFPWLFHPHQTTSGLLLLEQSPWIWSVSTCLYLRRNSVFWSMRAIFFSKKYSLFWTISLHWKLFSKKKGEQHFKHFQRNLPKKSSAQASDGVSWARWALNSAPRSSALDSGPPQISNSAKEDFPENEDMNTSGNKCNDVVFWIDLGSRAFRVQKTLRPQTFR